MSKATDMKIENAILPVLALRDLMLFPEATIRFTVGRAKSKNAINAATTNGSPLFLVTQEDASVEDPAFEDLKPIGVVATIESVEPNRENGTYDIVVKGLYRGRFKEATFKRMLIKGEIVHLPDEYTQIDKVKEEALLLQIRDKLETLYSLAPRMLAHAFYRALKMTDLSATVDYIAGNLFVGIEHKEKLLYTMNVYDRAEALCVVLAREIEVAKIEAEINDKVQEVVDKNQRDYYLREQIRVATNELGDDDSIQGEAEKFKKRIAENPVLDEKSKKKLYDECDRFLKSSPGSPEANVSRTYLERVTTLPWGIYTEDNLDVTGARKILEKDHYGLAEVKERILELIAVKKFAPDANAQILCLVGPPGVGKTSVARSLAQAIGRKYVRISLGGVHDEAEIRGHRKTYIGSMPGRIITAIEQAGTANPLILLDEIDKLGNDYKGDPSSALLEVLDGEQNSTFTDHYVEVPFDLSKTLFITTANDASRIPGPLFDRMEIIELYSYTSEDKFKIAKKHLVPKQLKNYGLTRKQIKFTDSGIRGIISGYTKEAGVRTLDRVISKIIRKCAVRFAEGFEGTISVSNSNLSEFLGAVKYKPSNLDLCEMIGAANGLAWTSVGGEMMQIEVAVLEGSGKLELTGSLGDVMKESAKAAVSYIRANSEKLGVEGDFYKTKDIHIHVPEGAVPKDGPSAGVTLTTALVSALTNTAVNKTVAMTGEITLRGNVLAIGGLREKATAAFKNGMKTVVIPAENIADVDKINDVVKNGLEFIPVSSLDEVLSIALERKKGVKVKNDKAKATEMKNNEKANKSTGVYCREV